MPENPENDGKPELTVKKNDLYNLEVVVFQVEDELFKVPKENFARYSPVISDMFKLPQSPDVLPEGHDYSHPIVLAGVKKGDFISLLNVLYPHIFRLTKFHRDLQARHTDSQPLALNVNWEMFVDECLQAYQLADMWLMEDIKDLMVIKVNSFMKFKATTTEKVLYGRQCMRIDWLLEGYKEIVAMKEIPPQDIDRIGVYTSIKLLQQTILSLQPKVPRPQLEDVFAVEISELCASGEGFPRL